ncbi:MAG: M3 family oligoendopeptidase [Chloroflexota bacterium]
MNENGQLPFWDMEVIFPGLESEAFKVEYADIEKAVETLTTQFDKWQIDKTTDKQITSETVHRFETIAQHLNTLIDRLNTVSTHLTCLLSVDSRDERSQATLSELRPILANVSLIGTRFTAWLGSLDSQALIERSDIAKSHAHVISLAQVESTHLMAPIEEALAAELKLSGSNSWVKLFQTYSSQIMVDLELNGEMQRLPLTAVQNLAFHEDRHVRHTAYEGELEALKKSAVPLAAALNAIKGEAITLANRRGWDTPLDQVLFQNAIDRQTFAAMSEATRNAFPDFRRYLKARAKLLGLPVLRWYDRVAPVGNGEINWAYPDAKQFILDHFGSYSGKMFQMAKRAFDENWIDVAPRAGKRGGAFCSSIRQDESRIMMNFEPSFASVGTLAHELGHAYHNVNLAHRPALLRKLPMTLAETASTFCQKIVENAALKEAGPQDQLIILDGVLEYATRVVISATSNFIFEDNLFKQRAVRDLSVEELCELDKAAQKQGFGEALDENYLYPYRWTYVPHYYVANYYNFPYTFGLLFGLGLYARFQQEPESFKEGYDELLSMTGMANAVSLAAKFGINIQDLAFWESSLDNLRQDIAKFEAVVNERCG